MSIIRRDFLPTGDTLRQLLDSTDIFQVAMADVFQAIKRGATFADEKHFIGFLTKVIARTAGMERRAAYAKKRSIERQQPLPAGGEIASMAPGPAELAACADAWQHFLAGMPEPDGTVIYLRVQGDTVAEIARKLQIGERRVERVIERQRLRWEREAGAGGGGTMISTRSKNTR
jgi:DNA-directed RNA polymerase specialized sigma24 family protein